MTRGAPGRGAAGEGKKCYEKQCSAVNGQPEECKTIEIDCDSQQAGSDQRNPMADAIHKMAQGAPVVRIVPGPAEADSNGAKEEGPESQLAHALAGAFSKAPAEGSKQGTPAAVADAMKGLTQMKGTTEALRDMLKGLDHNKTNGPQVTNEHVSVTTTNGKVQPGDIVISSDVADKALKSSRKHYARITGGTSMAGEEPGGTMLANLA